MTAHFEAKLHGFRRTQDGVVISYVIHPNDLSSEMALAPLGTRYMVAFAEIGDDDKPVNSAVRGQIPASAAAPEQSDGMARSPSSGMSAKDRRPFASLPLSQQAAIRCGDETFQEFIGANNDSGAAFKVRDYCDVQSRSEIVSDTQAGRYWLALERKYQDWLTTARYAHVMRK